jgi:uncharacterized protein
MILLVVFAGGVAAGFVDAIAGGGGLIMLPCLLFTGLPVGSAIATNKLCGSAGAFTSTLKFAHAQQIDWRASLTMGVPAIVGSYLGSRSIGRLPTAWAEPIVIALMIAITLFVVINPGFGAEQSTRTAPSPPPSGQQLLLGIAAGVAIGFHDGFFGPGTGVFLIFALLSLWSLDFLRGTGTTKIINLMTNLTALITFAASGNIDYSKGLIGALGLGIGSFVGATFATQKGAKLVKPVFIAVTGLLICKLLWDYVLN